jgi:uncharacterized cupin superfamily protein
MTVRRRAGWPPFARLFKRIKLAAGKKRRGSFTVPHAFVRLPTLGVAAALALCAGAAAARPAAADHAIVPLSTSQPVPALPDKVKASMKAPDKPLPAKLGGVSLYRAANGATETGLFEMSAGAIAIKQTADETDHVLKGVLLIHDDVSGKTQTFHAGDNFVMPKGFSGVWETSDHVTTLYVLTPALSPPPAK